MFTAVFFHELAHSSLVWYREGSCDITKLGEAGDFMEMELFGAISSCEISTRHMKIQKVGFEKGGVFYQISKFYLQSWPIISTH